MWEWIREFNSNVWHPYWAVFDLFITAFILYQLRKVSILLNKKEKDKK